MCYRPIQIYNPARKYNLDAPLKISVPCGHCPSCQRLQQQEWFFRSFIEYQQIKKIGGTCYFVTLTYDDEHLPHLTLPSGKVVPSFNGTHVKNFIKYLRIWLRRHDYPSHGIRYLICSEFGDVYQRPHLHALLYFPYRLNYWTNKIPEKDRSIQNPDGTFHRYTPLERALVSTWQHGFVMRSKLGWEILDIRGIRYSSKYVVKDLSYYNIPALKELNLYSDEFKSFKRANYFAFPRHYQSLSFGEKFCDVISKQTDIPSFLVSNNFALANDSDYRFTVPRYYHIKFEREIDKVSSKLLDKVVTRLSDIGLAVKRLRLEECILKEKLNLSTLRDSLTAKNASYSEFVDKYHIVFGSHCDVKDSCIKFPTLFKEKDDFEVIYNTLPDMLRNMDLYKLSLYRNFIRFMPLFDDEVPEYKFYEVSDIISHMVCNNYQPPEFKDVVCPDGLSEFAMPLSDNKHLMNTKLCCHHPYFADYERISCMVDSVRFVSAVKKEYDFRTKKLVRDKCKRDKGHRPVSHKSNFNLN